MVDQRLYLREAQRLDAEKVTFDVNIDIGMALSVIAQLQLAARHPNNLGLSRVKAEKFARLVQAAITKHSAAVGDVLESGWDPSHDVPYGEGGGR